MNIKFHNAHFETMLKIALATVPIVHSYQLRNGINVQYSKPCFKSHIDVTS